MWHIYSKYDLIICKEVDSHWPSQLGQQTPLFIPFKLSHRGTMLPYAFESRNSATTLQAKGANISCHTIFITSPQPALPLSSLMDANRANVFCSRCSLLCPQINLLAHIYQKRPAGLGKLSTITPVLSTNYLMYMKYSGRFVKHAVPLMNPPWHLPY